MNRTDFNAERRHRLLGQVPTPPVDLGGRGGGATFLNSDSAPRDAVSVVGQYRIGKISDVFQQLDTRHAQRQHEPAKPLVLKE